MQKTLRHPANKFTSYQNTAHSLAVRCGEILKKIAVHTTLGVRFPESGDDGKYRYHADLYRGAAGIGISLLDLFNATGDESYAALAREISYDLIESTPSTLPLNPGLYDGHAGIGLFHIAAADVLHDPVPMSAARNIAHRIASSDFRGTDIIAGAAGTGIFFLRLFNATSDRRYLDYATSAVKYLSSKADRDGYAVRWPPLIPEWGDNPERYVPHTGMAHGAAGIILFLSEMAYTFRDDHARGLLDGALIWLDSHRSYEDANYSWPVSLTDSKHRYHWCHGSAGIAQAYLKLFKKTGNKDYLTICEKAMHHSLDMIKHSENFEALYHCHGIGGIIEAFIDAGCGRNSYLSSRIVSGYIQRLGDVLGSDKSDTAVPWRQSGLELGTAGIARVLLRIAGQRNISILEPSGRPLETEFTERSETVIIKKPRSEDNPSLDFLWDEGSEELLPRIAEGLPDKNLNIITGPPDMENEHYFFDLFAGSGASRLFFEVLQRVRAFSSSLENDYKDIVKPGIFDNRFHGPFMREIAGISMYRGSKDHDLLHVVNLLTDQYLNMLKQMIERLAKDAIGRLRPFAEFPIIRMETLSSDPHNQGQRVMLLEFSNGKKLVYKGRSVLNEYHLAGSDEIPGHASMSVLLNKWLSPSINEARLPTHLIIPGDADYGYTEYIDSDLKPAIKLIDNNKPVSERLGSAAVVMATVLDQTEEERFWYSAGLLAGFAMMFGLSDLNQENIVCGKSVSCPEPMLHPVDLEMPFHEVDCLRDTMLVDLTEQEQPDLHAIGVHKHTGLARKLMLCGSAGEPWIMKHSDEGLTLLPGIKASASLKQKHLVINHDGTIGYGPYMSRFIRGIIDIWETARDHKDEIRDYLKDNFSGIQHRVLLKQTVMYNRWLRKFRHGAYPVPGGAWGADNTEPSEFNDAELFQLRSGDIPYFFEFLGPAPDGNTHPVCFKENPEGIKESASDNRYRVPKEFWKITGRQTSIEVLARGLTDAASFAAPDGPFDICDEDLGIRILREEGDPRIWIIVVLNDRRLTCRAEGYGGVSVWED